MARYLLQELPDGLADGKKVIYPKMQTYSMHDFDTVLKNMRVYGGSFSEGTMRGVIDALVQTMETWLPLGHTIKIDGLGVFSLSLGFDTSTTSEKEIVKEKGKNDGKEKDVKTKYRHVCIKGINFKPDPELLKNLNFKADFERVEADVKTVKKSGLDRDERIAKAKAFMDKNGYMTLTDYVRATGLSRTSASRELKSFADDPTTGIATRGGHSHKVWVKRVEVQNGTL